MKGNIQIESLLDKPVWQMTGEEYIGLTQYALATVSGVGGNIMSEMRVQKAMGVHALADELGRTFIVNALSRGIAPQCRHEMDWPQ